MHNSRSGLAACPPSCSPGCIGHTAAAGAALKPPLSDNPHNPPAVQRLVARPCRCAEARRRERDDDAHGAAEAACSHVHRDAAALRTAFMHGCTGVALVMYSVRSACQWAATGRAGGCRARRLRACSSRGPSQAVVSVAPARQPVACGRQGGSSALHVRSRHNVCADASQRGRAGSTCRHTEERDMHPPNNYITCEFA